MCCVRCCLAPDKDTYPALLMTTSTRDDRVHPYHARAFVHRLLDTVPSATTATSTAKQHQTSKGETSTDVKPLHNYAHRVLTYPATVMLVSPCAEAVGIGRGSVLYYENMEGGHGGAADNKQQAFMNVRIDTIERHIKRCCLS